MQMFLGVIILVTVAFAAAAPASSPIDPLINNNTLPLSLMRIAHGQNAVRYQFPYQVSIMWSDLTSPYQHICGGTLINEQWVLTAGHCKLYYHGTYVVGLGELNLYERHPDVQLIYVKQFIVHQNFPGGLVVATDDIALIELAQPAKLSTAIKIAPLADESDCDSLQYVVASGWGFTSPNPGFPTTLQYTLVPRITNEQCDAYLLALFGAPQPLDESMICTAPNPGTMQGHCQGDSGGPLVSPYSGKLVGVASWGIQTCGVQSGPSVYTRVCSHYDFINQYVGFQK